MPAGAPSKLTDEQKQEVLDAFADYIREVSDPRVTNFVSVNEVALQYDVTRDNINDWPEFSTLRKRAIVKQEDYLLHYGGTNKYNPTMAIFRLKQPQHGYTDKQERENTHKIVSPIMKLDEAADAILGNDRDTQGQETQ